MPKQQKRKGEWYDDTAIKMFEDCENLEKIGLHKNQKDIAENLAKKYTNFSSEQILSKIKNMKSTLKKNKEKAFQSNQFQSTNSKLGLALGNIRNRNLNYKLPRKPDYESDIECEEVESDTDNNLQFKFDDSQNEENYLPYNSDVDLKSFVCCKGGQFKELCFFVSPVSNGEIKYTIGPEDECTV
ncbi:hypothetical protein ACTFIW_012087 [Dictyostelium discoideum]